MTRYERRIRRRMWQRRTRLFLWGTAISLLSIYAVFIFTTEDDAGAAEEPVVTVYRKHGEWEDRKPTPLAMEEPAEPADEESTEEEQEPAYLSDEVPLDRETQIQVMTWCQEYGVPYTMALAVIETESTFRPDAKNGNCFGYMQINSINLGWLSEEIGVSDLTDPLQNLQSGIYMLGNLYEKYGEWHRVLTSYNFGEAGAETHTAARYPQILGSSWVIVGEKHPPAQYLC